MTSIRYDDSLDCHVVRHEGRDVAYFPAEQEAEATGFARRLHDGSAKPPFRFLEPPANTPLNPLDELWRAKVGRGQDPWET